MEHSRKIKLVFDSKSNSFGELAHILNSLRIVDTLNSEIVLGRKTNNRIRSEIQELKKGSYEITAFIHDNFPTILGAILATRGKVFTAAKETFETFDSFVDRAQEQWLEVSDGFPELEREVLREFYEHFKMLSDIQKERFLTRIRRAGNGLRQLRNIIF